MDNYKKIMIVGNGDDYNPNKMKNYSYVTDLIIVCDGGLNILDKLGIVPQLIIGDFDSIDKNILKKYGKINSESFPPEKDLTDSEIALKKAISSNPEEIGLFAMTGNYFDHSIANIFNLFRNFNNQIEIKIFTSNSMIFPLINEKKFYNLINSRISFFPFGNVNGLKMKGFKYFFGKDNISAFEYSVSNIILESTAEIKFESGMIMCILFDEGYS